MMQTVDLVRLAALVSLLQKPDPPDIRRGSVLRYEGEPNRRATVLPKILNAWAQRRHMVVDGEVDG